MIFDFGRCIYEPTAWRLVAYFEGGHKTKEQYEKELKEIRNVGNPDYEPSFNKTKKALCKYYAVLVMKMVNETVSIYLFDEDIEKLIIAIRASHKRGDNYVFANIDDFESETEDITLECHTFGGITTYNS